MATATLAPSLQLSVDRFARSLSVPSRLLQLHPRKRGNPGNYGALAPAIALGAISAFEGFAEDFFATAFYLQGASFAQIAKNVNLTNPSLAEVQKLVSQSFPTVRARLVSSFNLEVWVPPAIGASWWKDGMIGWDDAVAASQSWIQVRHCLTHGLTSGWRTEVWPGPVTKGNNANNSVPSASDVLRAMPKGKHSLVVHGAITCARIFRDGAEAVANQVAAELGKTLSWSQVPDFPLGSAAG
ncbi:hypothetical protein [Embleya sp. NBC_00896]|uniref:hypothetical protein n=1 Tax=Embleya sp. NBC_00896 TaxID=2975961 RepID=UPI002F90C844|nr:hypothetical protein OG928_46780 [Embleya sp. NBC_00896]